jgi:hypothetical protein
MLFDLRGAGRRRTVQAIYLSLAILMGGGLVLFGIGGNVSGGLLDAVKGNGGGSSGSGFEKKIERLEKRVRTNPSDQAAWVQLAQARYQETSVGENYDQATSTFTEKGLQKLRGVETAWDRYLALEPKKPDANVANLMVQAFGPNALNKPEKAVAAMEIVIDDRPKSPALYAQLAQLAYFANQTRKGDLAAERAVSLSPKDQREQIKQQLMEIKTQAATAGIQQSG